MIKHEIFYFGLSRTELQTLRCRSSFSFRFLEIRSEDFDDEEGDDLFADEDDEYAFDEGEEDFDGDEE
jgi:hypothetical protein